MQEVEFFFDYGSPFSYLASVQMPDLSRRTHAEITYRPMVLGAVLKATGNSSPMTVPAKAKYMALELHRTAARHQIPFQLNPHPFLSNTLRLMRGAVAAQKLSVFDRWHAAIYRAVWADAADLGNDEVLKQVVRAAGIDPAQLLETIERQDVKDELRANSDRAVSLGIFGAPTFLLNGEMYWGNDRLELVEEALTR